MSERGNKGDYQFLTAAEAARLWAIPNDSNYKHQVNLSPKSPSLTGVPYNLSLKYQPTHTPSTRAGFQLLLSEVSGGISHHVQRSTTSLLKHFCILKNHIHTRQRLNHRVAELSSLQKTEAGVTLASVPGDLELKKQRALEGRGSSDTCSHCALHTTVMKPQLGTCFMIYSTKEPGT